MRALQFSRQPAKYAAGKISGSILPGSGARWGPISLRDIEPPEVPGADWQRFRPRLAGICGSDLATIDGKSSRYFEPIVSFPFVPGHEVVGDLEDGSRAVLIPVLSCAPRGIDPPCQACASGEINRCERIAFGHLEPGLQSGFCEETGGGWSTAMVAHASQLMTVPDELSDESAVMVEPTACAVHAASGIDADRVVVIGAGTLGLLTIAALDDTIEVIATARYPEQRRWAAELGARWVVEPGELERTVRSRTSSLRFGGQLTGGAPVVIDCVGSQESLAQALRVVAPGGEILVVGMPATTTLDLTGLWHRETALRGCYAYDRSDFDHALELVTALDLGRLVTARYRLADYVEAISHAAAAGPRGAVKIAFDLCTEKERDHL